MTRRTLKQRDTASVLVFHVKPGKLLGPVNPRRRVIYCRLVVIMFHVKHRTACMRTATGNVSGCVTTQPGCIAISYSGSEMRRRTHS